MALLWCIGRVNSLFLWRILARLSGAQGRFLTWGPEAEFGVLSIVVDDRMLLAGLHFPTGTLSS